MTLTKTLNSIKIIGNVQNNNMTPLDVTFIIPSYNTINYTKMAYESVRKYYPHSWIIILDDGSTDGSKEYIQQTYEEDSALIRWNNKTGNILGHTVTYDKGIELAHTKLVTIFHSDMVCAPNYLENLIKNWKPKTVVCATRIEPTGIYGEGREKILKPFGVEYNEFKQAEFDKFVSEEQVRMKDATTRGIFAPWLISKEDFTSIGGHDAEHFAPYPEEDADLFLRFCLAGYELVQSRDALCYHWISRGHRSWATNGVGKDDGMFKFYQNRARRNYLRKWHRWMQFDEWHHPIPHKVYDTAFIIRDLKTADFLHMIEPFATDVFVDNWPAAEEYIKFEQPTTKINLRERMYHFVGATKPLSDSLVLEFSQKDFEANPQENMNILQNLAAIIEGSAEPFSEMQLGIFKLTTKDLKDMSKEMVYV